MIEKLFYRNCANIVFDLGQFMQPVTVLAQSAAPTAAGFSDQQMAHNPEVKQTAESSSRIGKIRAALVYYITVFVDSKNQIDTSPKNPIEICIIGDDQMNPYVRETLDGKHVRGRALNLNLMPKNINKSDLNMCEIVYLSSEFNSTSDPLISYLNNLKKLTICMVSKPVWGDCLIQIFEENNKAKIGIDLKNKAIDNFVISSELLEVGVLNK